MNFQFLLPDIKQLIQNREFKGVKQLLIELYPVEIADLIENLETSEAIVVLRLLDTEKAAEVLSVFEGSNLEKILEGFSDSQLAEIFEEMDPDDRTTLFEELPPQMVVAIISHLSKEDRENALKILNYPENSCGRRMSTDFVSSIDSDTVKQVLEKLKKMDISDELMLNIYVLDKKQNLKGFVPLTKLIKYNLREKISSLVESTPKVSVYDDVEVAARIITADDIIDIIQDSASEDIYRAVGMIDPEAKYFVQPLWERFWKRFIPVVIMIILGNISGWVINSFEEIIAHLTMLVFFIPNLANTTGIIGSQSSVFTIRAIATGEIERNFHGLFKSFL